MYKKKERKITRDSEENQKGNNRTVVLTRIS